MKMSIVCKTFYAFMLYIYIYIYILCYIYIYIYIYIYRLVYARLIEKENLGMLLSGCYFVVVVNL